MQWGSAKLRFSSHILLMVGDAFVMLSCWTGEILCPSHIMTFLNSIISKTYFIADHCRHMRTKSKELSDQPQCKKLPFFETFYISNTRSITLNKAT